VVASLSLLFGPLIMAPTVALAMAVTVIVHARATPWLRSMVAAAYLAAIFVPAALEAMGILAPSYALVNGTFALLPRAIEFHEAGTLGLLVAATVLSLLVPTLLVGRSIDALGSAERRQAAQVWCLRRLLPDAAPPT
jgi:hypothetical protein